MRLDPHVWAEIEQLAARELRSVNGQIEYLLREALSKRTGGGRSEGAKASKRSTRR